MPYREKVIEKKYFTISEVASSFGVTTSLIRFWESEFDTIKPKKNRKGNRQFTKPDIEHIRLIYHLVKERGFTLQGAKEVLKNNAGATRSKVETIKSLRKVRDFLSELKNQL